MDSGTDIGAVIAVGALLLGIFAGCAFVIKRFWIDKRYSGGQFIGREVYRSFQSSDRQNAIEEVEYVEDARREDASGDPCGDSPTPNCPSDGLVTPAPIDEASNDRRA